MNDFEQWSKDIPAFKRPLTIQTSSDLAKYNPCFRTNEGLKVYKKIGMDTSQGEFIFKINPHLNEPLILMPHELKQLSEVTPKLLKNGDKNVKQSL